MEFERTDIYQAILNNDTDGLSRLLHSVDVNVRGHDGRSYLHVSLDQNCDEEIFLQLLQHVDISWRDESSSNILDLAMSKGNETIQNMILQRVLEIISKGDYSAIDKLISRGWSVWPCNNDICLIPGVSEEIASVLNNIKTIWANINTYHQSITNPKYDITCRPSSQCVVESADVTGLLPLHKATIYQRIDHVQYLIKEFPQIINIQDNLERTALHYSVVLQDQSIKELLLSAGADNCIPDLLRNTPSKYQNKPELISIQDIKRHIKFIHRKPQQCLYFDPVTLQIDHHDDLPEKNKLTNTKTGIDNSNEQNNNSSELDLKRRRSSIKHLKTLVTLLSLNQATSISANQLDVFEDSVLYEAIITNDVDEVKFLLEHDQDTTCRGLEGETYLHLAVCHNTSVEIIKMLLKSVDVALIDSDGCTALEMSITENASNRITNCLLSHVIKFLVNGRFKDLTSMVEKGWKLWPLDTKSMFSPNVCEFLTETRSTQKKVDVLHNIIMKGDEIPTGIVTKETVASWDRTGLSAIHKAVIMRNMETVKMLLSLVPNIVQTVDNLCRTPLHYAACIPDHSIYNMLLLKYNANSNSTDTWGLTPKDYKYHPGLIDLQHLQHHLVNLMERRTLVIKDDTWYSLLPQLDIKMEESKLYTAFKEDNADEVKKLLEESDTDTDIKTENGDTLLHVIIKQNGSLDNFKALLSKLSVGLLSRNEAGQTVCDLIEASDYDKEAVELVKQAVWDWGKDGGWERLQEIVTSGWTNWPYTADEAKEKSKEDEEFMEKIEKLQEEIKNLHENIRLDNQDEVKAVLDNVTLMTSSDVTGTLPLQKAVIFQQVNLIKTILESSSKLHALNRPDNLGRTPLHYAGGCHDGGNIYSILKDNGADELNKDLRGKTPLDYYNEPIKLSVAEEEKRIKQILKIEDDQPVLQTEDTQLSQTSVSAQKEIPSKPTSPISMTTINQPIKMYISSDIYEKKDVPPPVTVDGRYIARHLGTALTSALAELAEKRPWDPIEHLAQWLYKYRKNLDFNKSQEAVLKDIRSEESAVIAEEEERVRREEEELEIRREEEIKRQKEVEEVERKKKEEEELLKKAKEASLNHTLPTVTEETEEDTMYKERDENGQTELHKLAAQEGADLVALFNLGYSLADRDGNNQTPRDIAEDNEIQENIDVMDSYITNMIEQEKLDSLQQLLLDGYDKLDIILSQVSTDGLPDEVTDFLKAVPEFQTKIQQVYTTVKSGVVRDVAQYLDRKNFAMAKDKNGRSPLHVAVLTENKDVVEYIIKHFPVSVKCRDNLNRTPLHYAYGVSEDLANTLLTVATIDQDAKDVRDRSPSYYQTEKSDIQKLQTTFREKPATTDTPEIMVTEQPNTE